jgi:protein TonB
MVSALAHAALGFFLVFSPRGDVVMPQGAIAVELVSLPSPAPAPAAKAARPAPPPPPAPKQVVLPKETAPLKPEAKADPKPAAPPKPKAAPPAEPATEREYSDVLSELRAEVGDEAPSPSPAPAQTAAVGSPTGQPVSPAFLAWERKARIHIRQNWVVPPSFRNEPLRTSIAVDLDAGGTILGEPRIVKRSGNPWYDDGVVRSIQKASPLPAPPEAGEWSFVFVADEGF